MGGGTEKETEIEQESSYKAGSSQENLTGNFSASGFPLGKATLCQLDLGIYSAFVSQSGQASSNRNRSQIYSKCVPQFQVLQKPGLKLSYKWVKTTQSSGEVDPKASQKPVIWSCSCDFLTPQGSLTSLPTIMIPNCTFSCLRTNSLH